MTDLITLAKQSGASTYTNRNYPDRTFVSFAPESLQAFSDLIAHKEREACEKVCKDIPAPLSCNRLECNLWDVATYTCADKIRERAS